MIIGILCNSDSEDSELHKNVSLRRELSSQVKRHKQDPLTSIEAAMNKPPCFQLPKDLKKRLVVNESRREVQSLDYKHSQLVREGDWIKWSKH